MDIYFQCYVPSYCFCFCLVYECVLKVVSGIISPIHNCSVHLYNHPLLWCYMHDLPCCWFVCLYLKYWITGINSITQATLLYLPTRTWHLRWYQMSSSTVYVWWHCAGWGCSAGACLAYTMPPAYVPCCATCHPSSSHSTTMRSH